MITSIFEPTIAVKKFAAMKDYRLFVAGDKKTNADWSCEGVEFISWEKQQDDNWRLSALLPSNHYCRKLFGYLTAIAWGADIIIDTDDDNIPYDDWQFPSGSAVYNRLPANLGFINTYQWFTKQQIWPRGLPLDTIRRRFEGEFALAEEHSQVGIWQGLADSDPDVDALYRLTSDAPCIFEKRTPIVLSEGTICPFNSQNTLFIKALFPLLYLPAEVTFRFTDILRGLVAQPIMWLYGYQLGFTQATVEQLRNPHNYLHDFESELPMYLHGYKVPQIVQNSISANNSVGENLVAAYTALEAQGIVPAKELVILKAWLSDLEQLQTFD